MLQHPTHLEKKGNMGQDQVMYGSSKWYMMSITGCSFSETLILTSINPKYDNAIYCFACNIVNKKCWKLKHSPTQLEDAGRKTNKFRISIKSQSHILGQLKRIKVLLTFFLSVLFNHPVSFVLINVRWVVECLVSNYQRQNSNLR